MGESQDSYLKEQKEEGREVAITYETLFEILRREKNRDDLQELHKTFFDDVIRYLNGKMAILSNQQNELFATDEKEKTLIQVQNIKKILRELYDRREKKIINLAINKARTKSSLINTSALLTEERQLFETLCTNLESFRNNILNNILDMRQTSVSSITPMSRPRDVISQDGSADIASVSYSDDSQSKYEKGQALNISSKESGISAKERRNINIKFLQAVPKFVGPELEMYGPFDEDEVATVPEEIANVLIGKGRAELYEE